MSQTFEEWWVAEGWQYGNDPKATAEAAWYAAWDQQQRVIDEMHLMFKDHILKATQENNDEC